jgi:hypothetical protein
MAQLDNTIILVGKSGNKYDFTIYSLNTSFNDVGAVYVFTHAAPKPTGGHSHSLIYVGQTGTLRTRLSNHHQRYCIDRYSANRICVMAETNEARRLAIEKDLIDNYHPPCNG